MTRIVIFFLLTTHAIQIFGQEARFPYLINGKYAISNIEGQHLTEAIYEDVIIAKGQPFIAVKKDGLWGFLNYQGQVVMQPVIKVETKNNVIGIQGPSTMRTGAMFSSDISDSYPFDQANLFYSNVWPNKYFFNPFVPNDNVQPFLDASKIKHDSKSKYKDGSFDRSGLYKVATVDSKINFLDTSGIPIFKQSVFDGFPISANILAIENESKKYALFNRNQTAISDFIYDEVQAEDDGNFIRAQQFGLNSFHDLFSNKGKLIADSLSDYSSLDHGMAIIKNKNENKVLLLDTMGKVLLSFPNAFLEFNRKRKDQFFYIERGQYGLIDSQGNFLVPPTYSSLGQLDNGNYFFTKSNYGGVLDSNYVEVWRMEGVNVSQQSGRSDLYNIQKQGVYNGHATGLVDQTGKVIFEPQYKFANFWKGCDLFYTQTDSTIAFYNSALEMIIPPTRNFKTVDCEKGKITFGETELIEFDLTGKPWVDPIKKDIQILSVDGKKFLMGPDRKALTQAVYSTLKGYKADSTGQQVFLGLRNESDPYYEIINEHGATLDLKDYGLSTKDYIPPSENGLMIVINKTEYTNKTGRVKKGVVDFNGEWVIQPDYQQVLMVQHELIYVSNPIKESISTYNRNGEKISSKPYIFENRNGNVQPSGRIEVTYGKNEKEYLEFLKQLWSIWRAASTNQTYNPVASDFPEMVYGYIDLNGKEVVETKYKQVSGFRYGYVCVVGADKAGTLYSSILDLQGKELCKTDYDEIRFFDNDSTIFRVKKNGLYGAIDITGSIKLDPTFLTIEKAHQISDLWTAKDPEATYLIGKDFKPIKIGPPGQVDLINLPGDYYCVQISNIDQSGQTPLKTLFYNSQGKLSQYDNAFLANNNFGKYDLPDGFVLMVDKNSKFLFVFNINTGKAYRE